MRPVKVALCQLDIAEEKAVNLSRAAELVGQAARRFCDPAGDVCVSLCQL